MSTDGRRRRGQDNRASIVAAMLDLVAAGDVSPSAEQVAARAQVGLRTVFRHFKDMDSLYAEMSEAISSKFLAAADRPFEANDWRGRMVELVTRRAKVFEAITPYRRATEAFRHRSTFLDSGALAMAAGLREILQRELSVEMATDDVRFETLDLLLSYETWSRLRREQGLSPAHAQAVLEGAVSIMIA
jgi:AcrR family transcriptional regulator